MSERPWWWQRQLAPPTDSALHGASMPTALRLLGASVAVAWAPPVVLIGYLVVTLVYAVVAVVLVPFLPPFALGVQVARGRVANPDLAIWGMVTGAWTSVVCLGATINERWFHHDGRTSHVIAQLVGAVWAGLATVGVWRVRRCLQHLERQTSRRAPWPPPT